MIIAEHRSNSKYPIKPDWIVKSNEWPWQDSPITNMWKLFHMSNGHWLIWLGREIQTINSSWLYKENRLVIGNEIEDFLSVHRSYEALKAFDMVRLICNSFDTYKFETQYEFKSVTNLFIHCFELFSPSIIVTKLPRNIIRHG